jgi:hypothetical protein
MAQDNEFLVEIAVKEPQARRDQGENGGEKGGAGAGAKRGDLPVLDLIEGQSDGESDNRGGRFLL